MKFILGHKVGMTQMWDDKGRLIAGTVIATEPNKIISSTDNQTLVGVKSPGKTNKAQQKIAEILGSKRGIRLKAVAVKLDTKDLTVEQFEVGDPVVVTGATKGKGFSGTIKRHNFHRGPVSHGSHNVRQPGSIGAQRPQRVVKGQKMAGRMGGNQFTARGSKIIAVDKETGMLILSGAVPGPNRGQVIVKSKNV